MDEQALVGGSDTLLRDMCQAPASQDWPTILLLRTQSRSKLVAGVCVMQCIQAVIAKFSGISMLGMMVWGCGAPPSPAVSPPNQPSTAAPELSHGLSCERVDALFQFESRNGQGAVSPMYGFPAIDQAEPTEEEAVRYLTEVLSSVRKMSPRFAPSVREKSTLIAEKLEAQRAVREKRIADEKKKAEESRKEMEAAKNDPAKMRQAALKDAAEYGMMGMLGKESDMGPLREEYFDAYLGFFDECATDLGISEKAQAAHHVIFPRKSERKDKE